MKKDLTKKIEIPKNTEVEIKENKVFVKGKEGENFRAFNLRKIKLEKKDQEIILSCEKATKREKRMMNTIYSHIKNMLQGVNKKFEYKLKICSTHFPITVKIEEGKAIIKNFLGEKTPRETKIPKGVEINIEKDIITVYSVNKEIAGQVAAKLEEVTKIKNRDKRIFQDGIYIIEKNGKKI